MGKAEYHQLDAELLPPIHAVNNEDLLASIACTGFKKYFNLQSLRPEGEKIVKNNGAYGIDQTATIAMNDGIMMRVHHITDGDNRGIYVTDGSNSQVVSKVVFRDRHNDGKFEATPPYYLRTINGIPEDKIPDRSRQIGFTSWSYSNRGDEQEEGINSLELSIVSADPTQALLGRLLKKNSLFVNPVHLAHFIDDPYAYIPFGCVSPETINTWWKYWFQVVDRGMRGKAIPQPGQTSQRGFEGFFSNTLEMTAKIAKAHGYTHLTAVPTWTYVWHSFIQNGFKPVDPNQADETNIFFQRMSSIQLVSGDKLSALSPKHPLASWMAVAPFVLELNPEYIPKLGIDEVREKRFHVILNELKNAVQSDDGIKTYPLAPGRNLWLSKEL